MPRIPRAVLATALAALALKLFLAATTIGTNDVRAFWYFLQEYRGSGAILLYEKDSEFNHPPFVIHWLQALRWIHLTTGLPPWFCVRFPAILADFGTVMVLMESVRRELEMSNLNLLEARDKLELLVQMDPLTEALNRHAFHSLLRRPENGQETKTSGSVAVIDIDNLKPINDTFGHTVGDKAIRAVARAMRSLVRADDMLFRWGGDEFLVLMFNLPQADAGRRLEKLNDILEENCRRWTSVPITLTVSYGVAGFASLTDLGNAIEAADKSMYARRHQARGVAMALQQSVLDRT